MSKITWSPRQRVLASALALCVVGIVVVIVLSSSKGEPKAVSKPTITTVRLQNIAIKPAKVTIKQGSTIKWVWLDGHIDTAHNVTSLAGGPQFKGSGTRLAGSYSIRFNKPGKYFYECTIHPASMQGEVIVQ